MKSKTSNIITLAVLAIAAYFLFFRKDREENNTTAQPKKKPATDNPYINVRPPQTSSELEEVVSFRTCPYCGTPNARITLVKCNGQYLAGLMSVECGNKSCPGRDPYLCY